MDTRPSYPKDIPKGPILPIIAFIAVVNAIGYGVIIPVLYTYTKRYGLTDFQNGLLFSLFSVCQFLSTPIIGRLSDKYGRKPLLAISLAGSAFSFLLLAVSPSATILFLARGLDGLTAGNIPVASAVISDVTAPKDRAKGFGILGAAFGFGFVFGPAISAFTLHWGAHVPFYISAGIAALATLLTVLLLPETNTHERELKKAPFFDLALLVRAIRIPQVGAILLLSLFYTFAFSMYIFAFQPYAVHTLAMSVTTIATMFTGIGIVGFIVQGLLVPKTVRWIGEKKLLTFSLTGSLLSLAMLSTASTQATFFAYVVLQAFFNSFVTPMIQTVLSKETDEASQGSIMGINASYQSVGTIIGPILGGAIATYSLTAPFLVAAGLVFVSLALSSSVFRSKLIHVHAFVTGNTHSKA